MPIAPLLMHTIRAAVKVVKAAQRFELHRPATPGGLPNIFPPVMFMSGSTSGGSTGKLGELTITYSERTMDIMSDIQEGRINCSLSRKSDGEEVSFERFSPSEIGVNNIHLQPETTYVLKIYEDGTNKLIYTQEITTPEHSDERQIKIDLDSLSNPSATSNVGNHSSLPMRQGDLEVTELTSEGITFKWHGEETVDLRLLISGELLSQNRFNGIKKGEEVSFEFTNKLFSPGTKVKILSIATSPEHQIEIIIPQLETKSALTTKALSSAATAATDKPQVTNPVQDAKATSGKQGLKITVGSETLRLRWTGSEEKTIKLYQIGENGYRDFRTIETMTDGKELFVENLPADTSYEIQFIRQGSGGEAFFAQKIKTLKAGSVEVEDLFIEETIISTFQKKPQPTTTGESQSEADLKLGKLEVSCWHRAIIISLDIQAGQVDCSLSIKDGKEIDSGSLSTTRQKFTTLRAQPETTYVLNLYEHGTKKSIFSQEIMTKKRGASEDSAPIKTKIDLAKLDEPTTTAAISGSQSEEIVYEAPTNLKTEELTPTKATLTWQSPAPSFYCLLYEKGAWGADSSKTLNTSTPKITLKGLKPGTTYEFKVAPVDGGEEYQFREIEFTTPAEKQKPAPAAPSQTREATPKVTLTKKEKKALQKRTDAAMSIINTQDFDFPVGISFRYRKAGIWGPAAGKAIYLALKILNIEEITSKEAAGYIQQLFSSEQFQKAVEKKGEKIFAFLNNSTKFDLTSYKEALLNTQNS